MMRRRQRQLRNTNTTSDDKYNNAGLDRNIHWLRQRLKHIYLSLNGNKDKKSCKFMDDLQKNIDSAIDNVMSKDVVIKRNDFIFENMILVVYAAIQQLHETNACKRMLESTLNEIAEGRPDIADGLKGIYKVKIKFASDIKIEKAAPFVFVPGHSPLRTHSYFRANFTSSSHRIGIYQENQEKAHEHDIYPFG